MKSKVYLLPFIFFLTAWTTKSFSQNYLSLFGDTSTTWDIVLHGYCDAVCSQTIAVTGDTTIGANTYKVIAGLPGFVREDTVHGKAWFYDQFNNTEYLVMDLALNLGDTFNIYNFSNVPTPFLVDSVYFVNNKKHVRLNAWTTICSLNEKITFIEGSGTTASFAYQRDLNGSSVSSSMLCHHKNGIKVSGNILFNDICNACMVGIDEYSSDKIKLNLFPNPTIGVLNIETNNNVLNNVTVEIYNVLGEQIFSQPMDKDLFTIDISNLRSGVYVLVLGDNISKIHQWVMKQ